MISRTYDKDLIPNRFFDKLVDITVQDLRDMGAKAVALDIDNTVAVDSFYKVFDGVPAWVDTVKKAGFPVMILTNTWAARAKIISRKLGNIPFIANAEKPDGKNFYRAADMMGVDVSELVLIGDQLFTDIRGANNAGAISVRVRPMHKEYVLPIHYIPLRHREHVFLREHGFGDKI